MSDIAVPPAGSGGYSNIQQVQYYDEDKIESLLLGRQVVSAHLGTRTLTLDDGTLLEIVANNGGCSCGAGDYEVASLAHTDNVITSVEFVYEPSGDEYGPRDMDGFYKIFVFAGDKHINIVDVVGDDGNGYYGTGFTIFVKHESFD